MDLLTYLQEVSSTCGGRHRQQQKRVQDGKQLSVTYAPVH